MMKIEINGFLLNEEHIKILLSELKDEKVKTVDELERYLKDHWYTIDNARKCHLLVAKHPNKRSFAIPFE